MLGLASFALVWQSHARFSVSASGCTGLVGLNGETNPWESPDFGEDEGLRLSAARSGRIDFLSDGKGEWVSHAIYR
jgi:hypothetical protein